MRVAIAQISSESNSFVDFLCSLETFRETGFLYEDEQVRQLADTDSEIAGMLSVLEEADATVIPLVAARAVSSGPLSRDCYAYLKNAIIARLRQSPTPDAVLLSHHGSMLAEGVDDPEGEIISAVRDVVGSQAVIVVTLDLHGNVTTSMTAAADAILGYRTYPHRDTSETGARAARLAVGALERGVRLTMAHVQVPMILTAFYASTDGEGPFAQLMCKAVELERAPGILSSSLFFVGSYIDVPEMSSSVVVVTNGEECLAGETARGLAQEYWRRREDFIVQTVNVAEAVRRGREIAGNPILLLDTADTTGGGAAGDSIDLVRGLLALGVREYSLAGVVDAEAAASCARAGIGGRVILDVGHRVDPRWGAPARIDGVVTRLSDGTFQYRGGVLGGATVSMGLSAVVRTGSIDLLISSRATYDWADEQYRSMGLDASAAKFVGVKNMMNFRVGYGDMMKGFVVLDLPGPTPPDMRSLPFRRVRRPIFPLDRHTDFPCAS